MFNNALFATGPINSNHPGVNIQGDVESGSTVTDRNPPRISGSIKRNSDRSFTAVTLPNSATMLWRSTLAVENNRSVNAEPNAHYGTITVAPNGKLLIDSGNSGDRIVIMVDTIVADGEIIVSGQGSVILYVRNSGEFKGTAQTSQAAVFLILLGSGASFNVQTSGSTLDAYIYGPNGTVTMSANATVRGSIVANSMPSTSNYNILYKEFPDLDGLNIDEFLASISPTIIQRLRWR